MESKTKIPFRYIAGGCFAASTIIYLIYLISGIDFSLSYLFSALAFAAIAVGLFLSIPMVSAAGSALFLILNVVDLFQFLHDLFSYYDSFYFSTYHFIYLIDYLETVIFSLILLVTCLNRRSAKTMGIIAAAVQVLYIIIIGVFGFSWYLNWEVSLWVVVRLLLDCAGAVFLGFAFSELKSKSKAAAAALWPSGVSDTYEKLTHLKGLLDKGIITQEDFDAKKKDILGS